MARCLYNLLSSSYCKNILDKVEIEMYNNFQDMKNMKITEEQLIDRFDEYIQENKFGLG